MSKQARAEARRAQRDSTELVMQAHNALHDGDVETCHEFLHSMLGVGPIPMSDVAPLADGLAFDHAFRDLCVKYRITASYVAAERTSSGRARLTAGGDSAVCAVVRSALEQTGDLQ